MGSKISQELRQLGFRSVFATNESVAGVSTPVRQREPLTWDNNNGVIVVYDELGSPWICRSDHFADSEHRFKFTTLLREYGVKRGAYVPHSNDGGHFIYVLMAGL